MANTTRDLDLLIFGATGFTGKLILSYLADHPQRVSFTLGISGRSKSKMQKVLADLSLEGHNIATLEANVTNVAQVTSAVQRARVVISVIGPYWRCGTVIVKSVS